MKHHHLNHVALHVEDIERSAQFYERVLELQPIPRPAFDFPGAWYRLGDDQELHLIAGQEQEPHTRSGANHFALLVEDMDSTESYLRERGASFGTRRTRPDGAFQIYLKDPDGHSIEICTRPSSRESARRLAALGGSDPDARVIPRRRSASRPSSPNAR